MKKMLVILMVLAMTLSTAWAELLPVDQQVEIEKAPMDQAAEVADPITPDNINEYAQFSTSDNMEYRAAILNYAPINEWPDFLSQEFDQIYVKLTEGESYAFYVNYGYGLQKNTITPNLLTMMKRAKDWPKYPTQGVKNDYAFLKNQTRMFLDIMKFMPPPDGIDNHAAVTWYKKMQATVDMDMKIMAAIDTGIKTKNPKYYTMAKKWLDAENDKVDQMKQWEESYFSIADDESTLYQKLSN